MKWLCRHKTCNFFYFITWKHFVPQTSTVCTCCIVHQSLARTKCTASAETSSMQAFAVYQANGGNQFANGTQDISHFSKLKACPSFLQSPGETHTAKKYLPFFPRFRRLPAVLKLKVHNTGDLTTIIKCASASADKQASSITLALI